MKIMTFNIRADSIFDGKYRWKYRKNELIAYLDNCDADVVGLQEVTPKMLVDLSEGLSHYHIIGDARTRRFFAEYNCVLVSKRHTVVETDTFWLSNHPNKVGSAIWFSVYPRICTTVKLKLQTGHTIRVFNTHLDVYYSPARAYGLRKIISYMHALHEYEWIPTILMGDFNTIPTHRLLLQLTDESITKRQFIAVQAFELQLFEQATFNRFKSKSSGLHLDYIFVTKEFEVSSVEIMKENKSDQRLSDHFPIVAHLNVNND